MKLGEMKGELKRDTNPVVMPGEECRTLESWVQ